MSLYSLLSVIALFGSLTLATPIPSDGDGSDVAVATPTNVDATSTPVAASNPAPTTVSGVENDASFGNLRLHYSSFTPGALLDGHLDEWGAASQSANPPFTQNRIDDFAWQMNTAIEKTEGAFWYFPASNDQDKNYTISFGMVPRTARAPDRDANPFNQNDVNNAIYRVVTDVMQHAPVACGVIWDPTLCNDEPLHCRSISIQVAASPIRQMALDFTCPGVNVDPNVMQQWNTIE